MRRMPLFGFNQGSLKGIQVAICIAIFCAILLMSPTVWAQTGFNYPDFSSTSGLSFVGSAAQLGNIVRLTPSTREVRGGIWYDTKQSIEQGFDTSFVFQITDQGGGGADGIAFVIQNDSPTPLGFHTGYQDISNSLAVEFDTWDNTEWVDQGLNHISVQTNGTGPNNPRPFAMLANAQVGPNMSDGNPHTAKIEYIPGSLKIYVDNLTVPVLTLAVDLSTTLNLDNGSAWVGLTAGTGASYENHDILSWSFTSSETAPCILYLPIVYPDFSSISGLSFVGSAAQLGNIVRLTPSTREVRGGIWYDTKQSIEQGFDTSFVFQITDQGNGGADGIAFVIQNDSPTPLGFHTGYQDISNSLAVEFDTWDNTEWVDQGLNHISVQTNGTGPNNPRPFAMLANAQVGPNMSDGNPHTAKIEYIPGSLKIYVDNLTVPVLTLAVDLSTTLNLDNGSAWVGLTAGTGASYENHDIQSWSFTSSETAPCILYLPIVYKDYNRVVFTEDFNDGELANNPTWDFIQNNAYSINHAELHSDGLIQDQSDRYRNIYTSFTSFQASDSLEFSYRGVLKQVGNPQTGRGIKLNLSETGGTNAYQLNIQRGFTDGFPTDKFSCSLSVGTSVTSFDLIVSSFQPEYDQVYAIRAVRQAGIWTLYVDEALIGTAVDPFGATEFQAVSIVTIGSVIVDDIVVER